MSRKKGRRMPRPAGWFWDSKDQLPHPENGKPACRWCHGRVDWPKRSYCSPQCSWEFNRRVHWKITREAVIQKANHKCHRCGIDIRFVDRDFCEKQYKYAERIESRKIKPREWKTWNPPVHTGDDGLPMPSETWWAHVQSAMEFARVNKCIGRTPGEVDHNPPVSLGGDYYDIRRLFYLCRPCHLTKTREDGSRLARKKKP